jgi:hypothetical protein
MINLEVYSRVLAQYAAASAPDKLYHYTSPEALIGIVSNKEMWATNARFLNDETEARHAIELMRFLISSRKERNELSDTALPFINELDERIGSSSSRCYIASFTELSDSLSQWRAYCPASGGYAIGLPAAQIRDMADSQGFMLVKCIYDYQIQQVIINEVLDGFIAAYETRRLESDTPERFENFVVVCRDYVAQLALLMKHSSFQEEKEWRLISYNIDEYTNSQISFRAGVKGVIPFFKFKLTNDEYPSMVARDKVSLVVYAGPAPDRFDRQLALQFLLGHHLGFGAYHGSSDIPYKTW